MYCSWHSSLALCCVLQLAQGCQFVTCQCGVDDSYDHLGYDAASVGCRFPTFRTYYITLKTQETDCPKRQSPLLEERNPVLRLLIRSNVLVEYEVTWAYIDLFRSIATLGTVCTVFCALYVFRDLWIMNFVAGRIRVLESPVNVGNILKPWTKPSNWGLCVQCVWPFVVCPQRPEHNPRTGLQQDRHHPAGPCDRLHSQHLPPDTAQTQGRLRWAQLQKRRRLLSVRSAPGQTAQ